MTKNHTNRMIHHNLRVWQRARELARIVYAHLPANAELRAQVRRSSISVGANIAEGCTQGSQAMRRKHYEIARGSAVETVAHYELAEAIGEMLPVEEVRAHGAAIAAMLTKMLR
jgi:four helix bundle protein